MNESHDKRLEVLEIKIAYQEQTIAQLNEVILEQQSRLDDLEGICRLLRDKLQSVGESGGGDPDAHEPPPHY